MELTLLYGDNKDSPPAALLLDIFYDVTLVTTHSGVTKDWTYTHDAAAEFGYAFETLGLGRGVTAAAVARMVGDGCPRDGIQHVHKHALEAAYGLDFDVITDGTHCDDHVPSISRAQAQSLGDRHGIDYLSPLSGSGRGAVGRLVESHPDMETDPSEEIPKADCEGELRHLIATEHEQAAIDKVFLDHVQNYVHGQR